MIAARAVVFMLLEWLSSAGPAIYARGNGSLPDAARSKY